jgi:Tol biopolymer transport system component
VVPLPADKIATHPDWSALGDQIAITFGGKGGDKSTEGGSIALLPYKGGSFGMPEVIVKSQGGPDNNYFPSFSPDSRFIAYVNASGKSEDAKSASLRLIEVASRKVIELTRLNQRVNNQDGVLTVGNSMPTWAPSTTPGIFWLAFSSVRQYAELRPADKKRDQIWIAAIDPSRADPSFAAFWAPFQSIDQGNHRAFWTHDDKDRQCRCVEVCGDAIDNDCNGSADEAGCVAGCAER